MGSYHQYILSLIEPIMAAVISADGYILESSFVNQIIVKYDISHYTAASVVRQIAAEKGYIRRNLSNELKRYYHLANVNGFPIVYVLG